MHVTAGCEAPVRPFIPPSALLAASMLGTCAVLVDAGWRRYVEGSETLIDGRAVAAVLIAIACGAAALLSGAGRRPGARAEGARRAARWAVAGLALGLAASVSWLSGADGHRDALRGTAAPYRVLVSGDASPSSRGWSFSGSIRSGSGSLPDSRVRVSAGEAHPAGTHLRAYGSLEPLPDSAWGRSRFMAGDAAVLDAKRVEALSGASGAVSRARGAVLDAIDADADEARALCAGVVCGQTTHLSGNGASEAFSACGLSHLVAVSGGHLVLISAHIRRMLGCLRLRRSRRLIVNAAVCCAYVAFAGCAPSAVRSAAMVLASSAAALGGRRAHDLSGLSIAATAMAAADPACVFDLGFQLSAVSVLFLSLFAPYVRWHLARAGLPDALADALSCTLCAQWATIPLTVPVFGELSLISPVANIVVAPFMNCVLAAGIAVFPIAAAAPALSFLEQAAVAPARVSIFCARALAGVPAACVGAEGGWPLAAVLYGVAALAYARWDLHPGGRVRLAIISALACAAAWGVAWTRFAPAEAVVMDVGQADAILIRDGHAAVLVDAGVDGACARALARNRVYRLDAVLVTHWDRDHYGGLDELVRTVSVDRLVVAAGAADNVPDEVRSCFNGPVEEVGRGDVLDIGGFRGTVVLPDGPVDGCDNEDSLVLRIDYPGSEGGFSMLLCGDAEAGRTGEVAAEVGDIDVLKLGHHGSKASVDDALLERLRPEVAVASAGEGNPYGHPDRECAATLRRHGVEMLCTAEAGDVAVAPTPSGPRVSWRSPEVRMEHPR